LQWEQGGSRKADGSQAVPDGCLARDGVKLPSNTVYPVQQFRLVPDRVSHRFSFGGAQMRMMILPYPYRVYEEGIRNMKHTVAYTEVFLVLTVCLEKPPDTVGQPPRVEICVSIMPALKAQRLRKLP